MSNAFLRAAAGRLFWYGRLRRETESPMNTPSDPALDKSTVAIRPLEERDVDSVVAMIRELARQHDDEPSVTPQALRHDALGSTPWLSVLVAEQRCDLVGYAALLPRARLHFGARGMEMHHLFVAASHRGQGIGRLLIEAAEAEAVHFGCAYLTVGTHPSNVAAQKAYLSCGFASTPARGPTFSKHLTQPSA